MAKLVSSRYALALFEAGLDMDRNNEFNKELDFLKAVFESEAKLLQIFNHPRISKSEKKSLIDNIFKGKLSEEMINFLYIIVDKRREGFILDIIEKYKEIFNEHENILNVVAITAIPMKESSKEKLKSVLSSRLNKKVELSNKVDKTVIGGVLLRVENRIIDGTVKGQLESIGKALIV
ncbi:F0F1 ATP synthase subunit delta [Tissierella pigra]|uniref:ATP synthase subunit delta n=1 Tax=Tissierella pigra TaxID=2607614 RepID=A0A6N7XHG4_9FIRM|nr:F0F1 ATP synthase subunit delta [Tissierella pigra]MBU5427836.1 F0F1 ATP synthase subunit delta [Tissierella pigra]MSU00162.1 F0F1 ATP synthase subunit delta [Tissierella pigra]